MSILARLDNSIPCLGILFSVTSSFFVTSSRLVVKEINRDLHPVVIVMVRGALLSVIWLIVIAIRRDRILGQNKREFNLLFLRGFLIFAVFLLNYLSLSFISLSDCTTIGQTSPIFTTVFAYFLLRERCGPINIVLLFLTLTGVLLIARPSFLFATITQNEISETNKLIGAVMALFSAISMALANIIMRKMKKVPAPVVVTWLSFCTFFFALLGVIGAKLLLPQETTITIRMIHFGNDEFLWLALNALCGLFAHLFLTLSLKVEEASTVALVRCVDILFSFAFQALFLKNEQIYWTSIVGAVIITVGVCGSALNKLREKRIQNSEFTNNKESTTSDPSLLAKVRPLEDAPGEKVNGEMVNVKMTNQRTNNQVTKSQEMNNNNQEMKNQETLENGQHLINEERKRRYSK